MMSLHCSRFCRAVAGVLVAGAIGAGAAIAQEQATPDRVVARINGEDVLLGDLDQIRGELGQQLAQFPPDQQLRVLIDVMVDIRLMARAAEAEGIAAEDAVMRRLANARDSVLRAEYLRVKLFDEITDERVRAEFDKELAAFEPQDQRRARHILVGTEEEAVAIIAELDGGGDFAAIASAKSTDPGSGRNGGDLGFFGRGAMVKPFEDAVFALEVGAYTAAPVQSQFGWHVIRLDEVRQEPAPTFESRARDIQIGLVRAGLDELSTALRAAAELEMVGPDGQSAPLQ